MKFYRSNFVALFHGTGMAWGIVSIFASNLGIGGPLKCVLLYTKGTVLYR